MLIRGAQYTDYAMTPTLGLEVKMGHLNQNNLRHSEPSQEEADRLRDPDAHGRLLLRIRQTDTQGISVCPCWSVCLFKVVDLHKQSDRNFFNFMGSIHYQEREG